MHKVREARDPVDDHDADETAIRFHRLLSSSSVLLQAGDSSTFQFSGEFVSGSMMTTMSRAARHVKKPEFPRGEATCPLTKAGRLLRVQLLLLPLVSSQ